jgi:cytochrome c
MRTFLIGIAAAVAVAALFVACKKNEEVPTAETGVTAVTAETAEVAMAGNAARGLELFKDTKLGTTGMSCESCHPDGGAEGMEMEGMATTKPLTGVKSRYPDKGGVTLAQMVNACLTGPLGGTALAEDSPEMQDLLAYLESL